MKEKNENKLEDTIENTIEYLIDFDKADVKALYESLAPFETHYFKYLTAVSVKIEHDKQASLLEVLSSIPDITYREAQKRSLGEEND